MKTIKSKQKLSLKKELIANLDHSKMWHIQGGKPVGGISGCHSCTCPDLSNDFSC